jgi:ABC-2 type transport system permease protein
MTTALGEIRAYRELLVNLVRRELRSRFRRTFLGWGWSFMQPIMMTIVYAIVLGVFLKATPQPGDPSGIDTFAFFLLAGVIPWSLFAGGLGAAIGSIANAGGLITRVWFPRQLLPMASIYALAFTATIELAVLGIAVTVFEQVMLLQYLPVALVLVFLLSIFTLGVSFWLAAANVRYKDVEYLTSVFLLAYFYLTPVLYPPSFVPDTEILNTSVTWQELALANPMARFVMAFRNIFYDVTMPGLNTMLWLVGWSALAFVLGFRFFIHRSDRFAEEM